MIGKIDIEKDPAFAHLGAGDEPALRAAPQFLRVHLQEPGSFEERQGLHLGSHAPAFGWE
ncbi:MAG TPA: hypothetical protein VKF40_14620 [Burkholderiales bacterium]|nr:hypothetical protein [Burkholderiales bacterium]